MSAGLSSVIGGLVVRFLPSSAGIVRLSALLVTDIGGDGGDDLDGDDFDLDPCTDYVIMKKWEPGKPPVILISERHGRFYGDCFAGGEDKVLQTLALTPANSAAAASWLVDLVLSRLSYDPSCDPTSWEGRDTTRVQVVRIGLGCLDLPEAFFYINVRNRDSIDSFFNAGGSHPKTVAALAALSPAEVDIRHKLAVHAAAEAAADAALKTERLRSMASTWDRFGLVL